MIRVQGASMSYDGVDVLDRVSFDVAQGEMFGIIGPNGSGKSTLLKLITGVEQASRGQIELNGKPISAYTTKQLAKWVAVLQQEAIPPVGFTVREVVEMGRYPFQNWFGYEEGDRWPVLIDQIMERLQIERFADRTLDELSGGERQRVALGKVMAQEPKLLLLDEPTTYLDIGHQVQMMDYIREWQRESNLTVVAVLHDLNLAAQYCDRLLLLSHGRIVSTGSPAEVIESSLIEQVYDTRPLIISHPVTAKPQVLLQSNEHEGFYLQMEKV